MAARYWTFGWVTGAEKTNMKRIIIVGASSGIGKELALRYAAEGNLVGITGRREPLLAEIQAQHPSQISTACFDVRDQTAVAAIKELIAAMGGLNLFIYNAGFGEPSEQLVPETELATTETNVVGCVRCVSFAFQFFVKQGFGQIAMTSSVAALRGNSWAPAYSASKAFMSNFAEGLSIKGRKLAGGIVVTDIRPGFIKTNMAKGHGRFWESTPEKAAAQIKRAIDRKKRIAYITRRWLIIALIMRWIPFFLYRRIV